LQLLIEFRVICLSNLKLAEGRKLNFFPFKVLIFITLGLCPHPHPPLQLRIYFETIDLDIKLRKTCGVERRSGKQLMEYAFMSVSETVGRKPVILLGSLVFTAGSVIMGLANTKEVLLVGRIVVGVGIGKFIFLI